VSTAFSLALLLFPYSSAKRLGIRRGSRPDADSQRRAALSREDRRQRPSPQQVAQETLLAPEEWNLVEQAQVVEEPDIEALRSVADVQNPMGPGLSGNCWIAPNPPCPWRAPR